MLEEDLILWMGVEEYVNGFFVILQKFAIVQCRILLSLELYRSFVIYFHLRNLQGRSELLADLQQQSDLSPLNAVQTLAYFLHKLHLLLLYPTDLLNFFPRLLLDLADDVQFLVHFLPARAEELEALFALFLYVLLAEKLVV